MNAAVPQSPESTSSKVDRALKLLGIVWSIVAFVVAAVFFLGGEWQRWTEVKRRTLVDAPNTPAGTEVANDQLVRVRGNLEVVGNRWDGEPKVERAGGSMVSCPDGWFVVGMRGVDTDDGQYCSNCISHVEFVCRKL